MGSMGTESEIISPAIFYWGTPVVLIATENEDGTFNIAPMSSAWWLGNRCLLGLGAISQTTLNLRRTKQCVLNLVSDDMVNAVNSLAKTTGTKAVATASPEEGYLHFKRKNGYKYVHNKFKHAGLSPLPCDLIRPARVAECPVQMEAELKAVHEMMQDVDGKPLLALEVKVLRTHIHGNIRMQGHANRIDPDKWRPLIMSFQEFYALGPRKIEHSVLAEIQEEAYRSMSNPVDEDGDDRGEDTR
ncbi:hypothetical protein ASPVEDRAFT_45412 [Aspergillus versicolor CBS 583.65]|uniref:Flavin reductase like domain-containing protein n=1 Tax=Aspergillus versicolor CBS 583.65 TaxID=1036611 RepID=A0A1L9PX39_ASPVE|nr:uncharacterized protein ASPVEDRAFT_45412 [Aspergillus versicolor CBS 583.65]OJJ05986.1 hypothetical protein ASPVEDRAFT_45412 [Aspergillus versicolor CBS 583.65]